MTDDVRALTLHQPWASLIAVGAKRIETRSWPTKYRGRLLVHAGRRWPIPQEGATALAGWARVTTTNELPLGAVVASCVLVDCVPMVYPGEEGAVRTLDIDDNGSLWIVEPQTDEEADEGPPEWREVSDRVPFGDFTPGRWAWLLDDVKPTTERCPRCWNATAFDVTDPDMDAPDGADGVDYDGWLYDRHGMEWVPAPCDTCSGRFSCAPVPMRGKQGLWKPTWEET
jgi:hypothetical protein